MASKDQLLGNAARATSYNIVLQISLRLITFLTNAFIVHYVSKDLLGVVNVRLTLLYTTTQFLTREAFRRACFSIKGDRNWTLVVNLLWLTVPLSIIWSVLLRFVWIHLLSQPDELIIPDYKTGVNSILFSVIIEMLAEPIYILAQLTQFIRLKVFIEGASLTIRCILMATLVVYFPNHGVFAFAIAQIVASATYSISYYIFAKIQLSKSPLLKIKTMRELFPMKCNDGYIDIDLAYLTQSFFKQTCVKQVLTEGERYIMTMFNVLTFAEQGVYDLINNLGSLAARFIFQPIEESGYVFFAQSLTRGPPVMDEPFASRVLENLLKIMLLLGTIILSFGTSYTSDALFIYGGPSLAKGLGPTLLGWHCVYIIFIALNGPTECFVFATMNSQAIEKYNRIMVILSAVFLLASYSLTTIFGSVGFILANCFNMTIRIGHSLPYIYGYFGKRNPLKGLILHPVIIVTLVLVNQITWHSSGYLNYINGPVFLLGHIAVGFVCLIVTLFVIFLTEKGLIQFVKSFFFKKSD